MPRNPRSYRFQIRTFTRHPDGHKVYGRTLWTEDQARVEKCPETFRRSTVISMADRIADRDHIETAAGKVPAQGWRQRFTPLYWAEPKRALALVGGAR